MADAANLNALKDALHEAGVEVYRLEEGEIHIAERVRFHMMDSGVRVALEPTTRVRFTVRSQRSDFPNEVPDQLFERVRATVGTSAGARGYEETAAETVQVTDPVDSSKVLDVWHEVTYEKPATDDVSRLIDEIRWALGVDKYISS